MSIRKFSDQGFDDFRKERKRMQAKLGPQASTLGYENQALRELEQVEAKEVREQQLTREVHEFFASATRQAASIVENIAQDAMQETGARVEQQMEAFLIDSLARMNSFVLAVLNQRRGSQVAEAQVEPSLGNLPGATLDEFRWEGTADIGDRHIGQDPFATDIEDVQREFRAQVGEPDKTGEPAPIEQHLVAAMQSTDEQSADDESTDTEPAIAPAASMPAPAPTPVRTATSASPAATATATAPSTMPPELEQFKNALKALVRQGVMNRDEARAAWEKRLQSMGLKA